MRDPSTLRALSKDQLVNFEENVEWEQSEAVVPASSNFRRRSAVRGQALGGGRPQCDTRLGPGGRLLAHKDAPDLVTATSG